MRGSRNWGKELHDSVGSTLFCVFMFILLLGEVRGFFRLGSVLFCFVFSFVGLIGFFFPC